MLSSLSKHSIIIKIVRGPEIFSAVHIFPRQIFHSAHSARVHCLHRVTPCTRPVLEQPSTRVDQGAGAGAGECADGGYENTRTRRLTDTKPLPSPSLTDWHVWS